MAKIKMFTCTALAKEYGAMDNKLYLVTAEQDLYGRMRYTAMNSNITSYGIQGTLPLPELETIADLGSLEDLEARSFNLAQEYKKVEFEAASFFEEITLEEVRVIKLRLMQERIVRKLQEDQLTMVQLFDNACKTESRERSERIRHEGAMRKFKYIEESNDSAERAKLESLSAEVKAISKIQTQRDAAEARFDEFHEVLNKIEFADRVLSIIDDQMNLETCKEKLLASRGTLAAAPSTAPSAAKLAVLLSAAVFVICVSGLIAVPYINSFLK